MMSVQERYLLECYGLSFVIACSLSSKSCAKEYPEKYHSKEAGDKLWQWTLRCYTTLCSVYSCPVELHQQSSSDISVTLQRPSMGAGEGKARGGSTLACLCSVSSVSPCLCQTPIQKSHGGVVSLQRTKCN